MGWGVGWVVDEDMMMNWELINWWYISHKI
jgi:hypothetical protein